MRQVFLHREQGAGLPRRDLLAAGLAAMASAGLSTEAGAAPRPLNILILGGTGFTGPHQVRYALSRGHKVTLFNRGRRPKEWPAAVEELTGDRDVNNYESLKGRQWDVCIDNPTSVPFWVRDAAAVLKGNVKHYIFISTVSVYESNGKPGEDETGARAVYKGADAMKETTADLRKNMALYGPLKALSEDEAHKHFAGMTTVIRPGLIVGPGDETDRFSYWPHRLQRGGKTLVPPLQDPVKFIDGRDLAEWAIRMAEQRTFGDFNAFGPAGEMSMGAMLKGINEAVGNKAQFVEASEKFLEENKVGAWMDLPVWVPGGGETAGFHRRSNARAVKAGLTFRRVGQTTTDYLAWWATLDEKRRNGPLRAGLKPEREAELLAKLGA
ncbi:NAD-dependent epimerase/dehydratase family protein [Paucibacter sp. JuS9]|uniref:NAD-dependent epimerase/dehydratase family protein n=1 Tax=Paucibacter sp. JuS9 TaxID=3228748 RepID=UPI003756BC4C